MMRFFFLVALLINSATLSYAEQACVTQWFWKLASAPCLYKSGECQMNVRILLELLKEKVPGFDLTKANVLYFTPIDHNHYLRTTQNRHQPKLVRWLFHVVMEYDGKIYDLDALPRILPQSKEKYFAGLFAARRQDLRVPPDHLSGIEVRVIPGEVYFKEFNQGPYTWDYYLADPEAERRFRVLDAKEYLKRAED